MPKMTHALEQKVHGFPVRTPICHIVPSSRIYIGGGSQTGGFDIFSGKGHDCAADPFANDPCRCFTRIGTIPAKFGKILARVALQTLVMKFSLTFLQFCCAESWEFRAEVFAEVYFALHVPAKQARKFVQNFAANFAKNFAPNCPPPNHKLRPKLRSAETLC